MAEPESVRLSSAFLSTLESIATWRAALFRALDSSARANVAQTCHAAQQLLLAEWPSATLRMSVQPAYLQPAAALLRRMHRVRQQLALRGGKPVTLALQPDGYVAKEDVWWHTIFSALGTGQPWPGLTLELRFQHIQPQLLAFAGQALPGLKSLSIGCLYGSASVTALPPPASLPALRHLEIVNVRSDSQSLWQTVGPYLAQLQSLSLPDSANETAVFASAQVAHSLRRLHLGYGLTVRTVQFLQIYTPRYVTTYSMECLAEPSQCCYCYVLPCYRHASESSLQLAIFAMRCFG